MQILIAKQDEARAVSTGTAEGNASPVGKLIGQVTTTLDGVITVAEWYVSEGAHDGAGREQFREPASMLLGRKTYEGLAAYWSPLDGLGGHHQSGAEVRRLADARGAPGLERAADQGRRSGRACRS